MAWERYKYFPEKEKKSKNMLANDIVIILWTKKKTSDNMAVNDLEIFL